MPLTCNCDWDYEFEPGEWYYYLVDEDFEPLNSRRRKRCASCCELIDVGALCLEHRRVRYPYTEAEARINGAYSLEDAMCDEATIQAPSHYHCEKCGEIWLNLQSVGFNCLSPRENMPLILKEYQEVYQPPKLNEVRR